VEFASIVGKDLENTLRGRHDDMKVKDAKGWNAQLVTPHEDRPRRERGMVAMFDDRACPKLNERGLCMRL